MVKPIAKDSCSNRILIFIYIKYRKFFKNYVPIRSTFSLYFSKILFSFFPFFQSFSEVFPSYDFVPIENKSLFEKEDK